MSKRRRFEGGVTAETGVGRPAAEGAALVVVPRRWLIALLALVIAPWPVAWALYTWTRGSADAAGPRGTAATPAAADAATAPGGAAVSGRLLRTPIVISPPLEYVPTNWGPIQPPTWYFPRTTPQQLQEFLSGTGLGQPDVDYLRSRARPAAEIDGMTVMPEPGFVRRLAPQVRAAIYVELARSPLNDRQRNAYRFYAAHGDTWLTSGPISPRARQLVEALSYRHGDFLYFADIDLVRSEITDAAELQHLAKRLLRESTLLLRLRLDDVSRVDAAAEYWGRGGRRKDVRPLLESIAVGSPDQTIDIAHLLPPLARQQLYRYPRISLGDLEKAGLANCFWTALNFFNPEPDDRFLDSDVAINRLKRDYYIVHDGFQLGDIVAFADRNGRFFHAAVYLAEDLVFGKNGTSPLAPWTIIPIDRLKGYFVEHADDWRVVYYRRADL